MTRRFTRLAWAAAACTYLLIVLGAVVRITGSGLGCGEHWPRCHGRWFPPLNDIGTLIEWNHRLFAGLVTVLVAAVAALAWWESRDAGCGMGPTARPPRSARGRLVRPSDALLSPSRSSSSKSLSVRSSSSSRCRSGP